MPERLAGVWLPPRLGESSERDRIHWPSDKVLAEGVNLFPILQHKGMSHQRQDSPPLVNLECWQGLPACRLVTCLARVSFGGQI